MILPLQVVWFYNKTTRLSTSDRLSLEERKGGGQTLTLHKLSYNDFGLYTCRWYTSYHVAWVKERVVTISETHLLVTFCTPQQLQTFISYEQLHLNAGCHRARVQETFGACMTYNSLGKRKMTLQFAVFAHAESLCKCSWACKQMMTRKVLWLGTFSQMSTFCP